ncbi:hypothetical protein EST62_12720 [Chlorobaculum sp. 24CR]|uniref:polysaccharide deacetylase family protein n=1 Tax=Chlorobaculum sp. 24CR TaxID=2508878 RepID=UPI00100AF790|nr:polysaccharide deacetylase family protein [Chlorobaculum sp. 24CR]RXK80446.1 hypothetical protein EST62_12720 [Chlorobaculum sp. 24CR]
MIDPLIHALKGNYSSILMLHRISSIKPDALPANQNMNVSPDELADFITNVKRRGWVFLSLDEMYERLVNKKKLSKTLVLTADDGYRDNLTEGLEVISAYKVPLCVYVTTSFPDKTAKLWWYALEDAVCYDAKKNDKDYDIGLMNERFIKLRSKYLESYTNPEKYFSDYFPTFEPDWNSYCEKYCLKWDEIVFLSKNPQITIGAHTVNHACLQALTYHDAWKEIENSKTKIQDKISLRVEHFCYPFGGSDEASSREYNMATEMGFKTATTTVGGNVFPEHKDRLTSLPRYIYKQSYKIGYLSGLKQNAKYVLKSLYV